MDSKFYEWAKRKLVEMKSIDFPDRTAMSMVKGVMEADHLSESEKLARVEAVIQALDDTK
ncbi:hypothetical protein [Paenibacillus elgii]|uniref:hypothetical protein n=1 Tax=Paenibacillus elgii TaxID=189691 RepID=UPI0013D200D3|nr:hypothetical protein [Paenibacillus elgii]